MNAVALNGSGDVDEVDVEHGNEGDVMLCGEIAKNLLERVNVVGTIIGRKRDAGEQDLDVSAFEAAENLLKIFPRLVDRQTAQAIVAAELNDDDFRVHAQNEGKSADRVFRRGAAGALIDDVVGVAVRCEKFLKIGGISLIGRFAEARCDAVAVANEGGAIGSIEPACEKQSADCDQN